MREQLVPISSRRYDIMRFSVLGFRSDIRIEFQVPVFKLSMVIFVSMDFCSSS